MQDCVRCVLDVVRVIYDDVKRLEAIELPPKIAELYEPLGSINDCIYFKYDNDHYGVSDIKVSLKHDRLACSGIELTDCHHVFTARARTGHLQHFPVVSVAAAAAALPSHIVL